MKVFQGHDKGAATVADAVPPTLDIDAVLEADGDDDAAIEERVLRAGAVPLPDVDAVLVEAGGDNDAATGE